MRRLNQDAIDFISQLSDQEAEGRPSAFAFPKLAAEGHWRKLPAHHKGETEQGEEVYGKTWVDREEKPSKKKEEKATSEEKAPTHWTPESFKSAGKQVVLLGFDSQQDAVMYGRPSKKGTVVFHLSLRGAAAMEKLLSLGHGIKSDTMHELFQLLPWSSYSHEHKVSLIP